MSTAGDDIATAEQEATEAQALADALEERVKDGDDSVTAEELDNATRVGRFARLRVEAAKRKAERARQADFEKRAAKIKQDAKATTPDEVADEAREACNALRALAKVQDEQSRQYSKTYGQIQELESDGADIAALGLGVSTQGFGVDDQVYRRPDARQVFRAVVLAALAGNVGPQPIQVLDREGMDLLGGLVTRLGLDS